MARTIYAEKAFRAWLRELLEKKVGDDADKAAHFYFLHLQSVAIDEIYFYLDRHHLPAPRKTTAHMLGIDPKTVKRAIK